jgi:hypothetical protein
MSVSKHDPSCPLWDMPISPEDFDKCTCGALRSEHDPSCPKAHPETRGLDYPAFRCTCGLDDWKKLPGNVPQEPVATNIKYLLEADWRKLVAAFYTAKGYPPCMPDDPRIDNTYELRLGEQIPTLDGNDVYMPGHYKPMSVPQATDATEAKGKGHYHGCPRYYNETNACMCAEIEQRAEACAYCAGDDEALCTCGKYRRRPVEDLSPHAPPHDPDCPAFKNPRNVCVCKTPEEERGIRMVRKTGWLPELLREANKTARDVETLARGDLVRMWIPYAADEFWMVMDTPGDDKIVELQRLGDINAPMLRVPLSLLATTDVYLKANRK